MRIAVISDTHDKLPEHLCEAIRDADEIWHLGDVCDPSLFDAVLKLGPPVRVVRGNCDYHAEWPFRLNFKLASYRIHLEHIPDHHPAACDLFLHGHTHVPRNETIKGVQFLNPGCVSRPNRGAPASYAWLTLEEGKTLEWEIVLL